MLKNVFYCLITFIFLCSCGSTAQTNSDETIGLNEAIAKSAADIMKKVPSNTTIALFNISESDYSVVTEYVIEEISAILVDKAKLIVVDRNNMDVIDAEHKFQASGRVSDDEIISIAKKNGATSVVSCSVSGQFDLRRLRVRALEVETGKVLSLTSHSVKNLSDYAKPQAAVPTQNNVQPVAAAPAAPSVPTQLSLTGNDEWYPNTLPPGATHYYRFRAGNVQSYFIEWHDYDTDYHYADIKVGVQRDGSSSFIVPISDDGNYALNRHLIRTTPGDSYVIVVQGYDDNGDYQIKCYPEKIYQIGDAGPARGIVFYDKGSFSNGWRYLEAAPADTEMRNLRWGAYGRDVSGTHLDLGSGKQNTQTIIGFLRSNNESGRAAQLCVQLNSGGATDWFLPSREELHWMYLNLHKKGFGGFKNSRYWSSSQVNSKNAWYLHFGENGRASYNYDKDRDYGLLTGEILTRAIRSF